MVLRCFVCALVLISVCTAAPIKTIDSASRMRLKMLEPGHWGFSFLFGPHDSIASQTEEPAVLFEDVLSTDEPSATYEAVLSSDEPSSSFLADLPSQIDLPIKNTRNPSQAASHQTSQPTEKSLPHPRDVNEFQPETNEVHTESGLMPEESKDPVELESSVFDEKKGKSRSYENRAEKRAEETERRRTH